jgi:predicted RNA binding protein YcfA (HicA-like mRNA interferase family)
MPKLLRVSGEALIAALKRAGFETARQSGNHVQMRRFTAEGRKITFPVPVHSGKTLKPGTLKGILRLAELTVEELERLL